MDSTPPVDMPLLSNIEIVDNQDISLDESKDSKKISVVGAEDDQDISQDEPKDFTAVQTSIMDQAQDSSTLAVNQTKLSGMESTREQNISLPVSTFQTGYGYAFSHLQSNQNMIFVYAIYSTSFIKKHYSRNVINKLSESKNDTMGPGSKNVVNDMSKSESTNKSKMYIEADIWENTNIYNRWSPSSYKTNIRTYSISDHPTVSTYLILYLDITTAGQIQFSLTNSLSQRESFMRDTVLQHSMGAIIPLTFA